MFGMDPFGFAALGIVGVFFGLASTLFWMWLGWRTVSALERLTSAIEGRERSP